MTSNNWSAKKTFLNEVRELGIIISSIKIEMSRYIYLYPPKKITTRLDFITIIPKLLTSLFYLSPFFYRSTIWIELPRLSSNIVICTIQIWTILPFSNFQFPHPLIECSNELLTSTTSTIKYMKFEIYVALTYFICLYTIEKSFQKTR